MVMETWTGLLERVRKGSGGVGCISMLAPGGKITQGSREMNVPICGKCARKAMVFIMCERAIALPLELCVPWG